MRVSTSMLYGLGAGRIGQQQSELLRTQQQLSTGRRMLSPSDDPVAAAQMLREGQAKAMADQYATNQGTAKSTLAFAESVLGDASAAIADARTVLVSAGSGILGDSDRRSLALELRAQYDRLLGMANSRGADGEYLFAGYRGHTQPFSATAAGAQYNGDEGARMLDVDHSRAIPVTASGAAIFDRVPSGNGTFAISPGAGNAGTGVHDGGAVADPAQLTGHGYRVQFNVAGATTTYDVLDLTAGTTLVSGAAYGSGQAIAFDGVQLAVTGTPADNDTFDVSPSAASSVFRSLKDAIALLETSASTPVGRARLGNGLASGIQALDQASGRVLDARAAMGAHLQELDSLGELVSGQSLHHAENLSRLGDLDYAEAITRFASQQAALQAAQQSFLRISNLSLFDQF